MAGHENKRKSFWHLDGFHFTITMITVSLLFIFVGYFMGQYAVGMVSITSDSSNTATNQEQVTQPSSFITDLGAELDKLPAQEPEPQPQLTAQPVSTIAFRIQAGAFGNRENAEKMQARLIELGYEAMIVSGALYRVQTGGFASEDNAQQQAEELRRHGFEVAVVRAEQ